MKNFSKLYSLVFFLFFLNLSAKEVYVATNGNDSNTGTVNSPYKTFAKAVSVMSAGDVCIIRAGVYEEELIINKNGTAGNYLTFKAAAGEEVEIKATKVLNGWELHTGNIYKASVNMQAKDEEKVNQYDEDNESGIKDGENGRFRAVYHNEEYMDLARWPNNTDNNRWTVDCHPVDNGDDSHFQVSNIPNIDWTGGLVYYLGAHSGASWTRTITNSSSTRIDFTPVNITKWPFSTHNPTTWRNYPGNNRGQFYLFDKLEALDHAREWYYDNSAKLLYLQTADGTMPADGTIQYATRKFAAQIEGDYIKIEGINFFGGSVIIHNRADNNEILNCKITHGSEGHDSLSNTSAQVGEAALEILGDNTIVKNCTVNHSSVSGIIIAGWAAADCTLEGNTISNIDYVGIHASPIRTSANDTRVLKNTIFNAGRDGMYVAGSNCEIAYNDVSASQRINSDSGVFYTVGNSNLKNNEIHHNWFHDATAPSYSHNPSDPAKAAGIYLDNDSKGYSVHHNVVWNVSWSGYQVNWNNTHLDFFHNTIWNAERAMDSWVNGRTQENNRIYNNFANTGEWFTGTANDFDIKDNLIANVSPFEDPDDHNFAPKFGSQVVDKARNISDFEKPFFGNGPDIGAYEFGATRWTAGVDAIEDTGEGRAWNIFDTNFTIAVTSETCPNKNNGQVRITADYSQDYILNFNGNESAFTNGTTLTNIAPGAYEFCIYAKDKPERQCFNFSISEGKTLGISSSLSAQMYNVNITTGTPPFKISVNGTLVSETLSSAAALTVNQGDIVKVSSSVPCEGELVEQIDLFTEIELYPNPTQNDITISMPINKGQVPIELYTLDAQLISSKEYTIENGKIYLSLANHPPGIYFAKLVSNTSRVLKIIKK